jgi:hypothetical protein
MDDDAWTDVISKGLLLEIFFGVVLVESSYTDLVQISKTDHDK